MVAVPLALSSSVHPSETSETSSATRAHSNTQRAMHARDLVDWLATPPILGLAPDLRHRAERIAACCCCPLYVLTSGAKLALVPGLCRDRLCPTCARRRSRDVFHRLHAEVGKMDAPRFITLTLRHKREPLFLTLARLRASFRELRRSRLWSDSTAGGVYSIEVKRNAETGCWHAHIHVIADGHFIAQARLSALWKIITGDSCVVDIRAIRSKRDVAIYVTKYISKPADVLSWPAAAVHEYARDMAGVRAVHTFGKHHGTHSEATDDGCYPGVCEPLASARRVLRAMLSLNPVVRERASHATYALCRTGGMLAAALGQPAPPPDYVPEPLSLAEFDELIGHLRFLGHSDLELDPAVACTKRAMLRIAYNSAEPWTLKE